MTIPHTSAVTGSSGRAKCAGSSIRLHLRARTVAANTTSASFASSDGWIVTGPSEIHRDEPYASIPAVGWSTRASNTAVNPRRGTARRCHASYRIRDVTTSAAAPTTAYAACRWKNRKLEPYCA